MTNKETILKTVRFIESNLRADIGVIDIAREGCYSLYHFIRLFQSITGTPPNKYLTQRRLSEACLELRDSDKSIADIAYEYQFGSPETFTRAFKKQFGVNPSQVRNNRQGTLFDLVPAITEEYIYQSDKARNQEPELVELGQKILVGIAFFMPENARIHSLSKEWGQFMNEVDLIPGKISPQCFYQVQYWSENQDLGGLYFYLGVEVKELKNVPPQFVVKIIPEGSYLRFIHRGLANKVGYTYRYIYHQFLPETDYKLTKPFNFEFYGEKCLGPDNEKSESEIYIPVDPD